MFSIQIVMVILNQFQHFYHTCSKLLIGLVGAVFAALEPTIPYILVCTLAVFADCVSAWLLSKRVKKKYPGKSHGKFKSNAAGKVFLSLLKIYSLIFLTQLIDTYIMPTWDMHLSNIIAGAVCFWQLWSILENESSCNNAKWAKIAQKIMIDKTERHFDVDLSELKDKKDDKK